MQQHTKCLRLGPRVLILRNLTRHSVRRIVCALDQGVTVPLVLQQNTEAAHNVLGRRRRRRGFLMGYSGGIYCWSGCKRLFGVISSKSRLPSPTKAQQADVEWQLLCFLKSLAVMYTHRLYSLNRLMWKTTLGIQQGCSPVNLPAWVFHSSLSPSRSRSQTKTREEKQR